MTLDKISEEINKAKSIAILTHESPDGDAIGSSLAMLLALKKLGKNADLIIPEVPRTFSFLPGISEVKKENTISNYDLVIALDCADIKRLNGYGKIFEQANTTINIDHHGSNKMFADYNYVDPVSPACAQILIVVFNYLNIEITKDIGTCLLTGIITDTGGFQYSGVNSETFEFTSWLLNKGVNVSDIYRKVLQIKTKPHFELRKLVIDRLQFLEEGKIAFTYITEEDELKVGAETGDHEGLVEIGRDIEGVEVSILLREAEKGFKASLRSNEYVNVSDVCIMFGGGGHPKAAGCLLQYPLEQAKQKIINEVKNNLNIAKI